MRWLDSITDSLDMNLSELQEIGRAGEPDSPWSHKESDVTEWLNTTKGFMLPLLILNVMNPLTKSLNISHFEKSKYMQKWKEQFT